MTSLSGHILVKRKSIGKPGDPGLPGLIHRTSEWAAGVQYRNDSALTSDERYLDIAVVTTGPNTCRKFKCKKTHTSSSSITYTNTTYWEEMNSLYPIYTPLIMADSAVFRFAQTNQLLVMKDDGVTVNLGMGGGDYPLWIGAPTPGAASFKVSFGGKLSATGVDITGKIIATSGKFGPFTIGAGEWDEGSITATYYDDEEYHEAYELDIQSNKFWIAGGPDTGPMSEFVLIMPYRNPDKYDSDGMVWISSADNSIALRIDGGMLSGIRPDIYVTSASGTITHDTIVVRGSTAKVTLGVSDYQIKKGTVYHIINDSSYDIRISVSNDQSINDLINNHRNVTYADIGVTVKSFWVTYDGSKIVIYE